MRNIGLKITAILLFVLQAGAIIKLFFVVNSFLKKNGGNLISSSDKLILFGLFILIGLTLIGLVAILFFGFNKGEEGVVEVSVKKAGKDRRDRNQMLAEEQKRKQELKEKKQRVVSELIKGLDINDGAERYSDNVLVNISKQFDIMQGILFLKDNDQTYRKKGAYAFLREDELREFTDEIGLSGQVAFNKKLINISNIPEDYLTVLSGLGKSSPANLIIFPILSENETIGIVELASFVKFDSVAEDIFMKYSQLIGKQLAGIIKKEETPAS